MGNATIAVLQIQLSQTRHSKAARKKNQATKQLKIKAMQQQQHRTE